ncbi:MAG: cytochrome b/b6 domain-containing protein [Pseudomonadota bacterium]
MTESNTLGDRQSETGQVLTYRHPPWVRICHWLTAISIILLLITGVVILLAHPRLYWGEDGFFGDPAFISFGHFEYADYLGASRSVHFFFAWVLGLSGTSYALFALARGRIRKFLVPERDQVKPAHIVAQLKEHIQLKVPTGKDARRYNLFQKIAYSVVLFVLIPGIILSGLAMSPSVAASYPDLFKLFGGRQSARTIHFLLASSLLLFFLIHLFQVLLVGFGDGIRSMTTGWHTLPQERAQTQSFKEGEQT